MLELELFYKIVESAIRGEHVDYLKGEKRVPLPLDLPEVTTLTKEEEEECRDICSRLGVTYRIRPWED